MARHLALKGHACRCWYREGSDRGGFEGVAIEWLPGQLGDDNATRRLVAGCDAVVHAALFHPGGGFRGGEGDLLDFVDKNVLGTLRLIEAAGSSSSPVALSMSGSSTIGHLMKHIPLGPPATTVLTRRPSNSLSIATATARGIRSVRFVQRASTASHGRWTRANGSTW
jgi:nucleoside-diphosphate-sugar epimerase